MNQLNFYKPTKNFPKGAGSAFQFKAGTKTNSRGLLEPCIFVEAVAQSKPKPQQGTAKESAFVWVEKGDDGKMRPHGSKIIFCLSITDLSKIDAFFTAASEMRTARLVLNSLQAGSNHVKVEIPPIDMRLVHQTRPKGADTDVSKGFILEYPAGQDNDPCLKLTSNAGVGHNVIKTFLKVEEQALVQALVRGVIHRYFFTTWKQAG